LLASLAGPVLAQDSTTLTPGNAGGAFGDPERLVETLIVDDRAELEEATAALDEARTAIEQTTLADALQAEQDALSELDALDVDVSDPDLLQDNIEKALLEATGDAQTAGEAVEEFDDDAARGGRLAELEAIAEPTPAEQAELDALRDDRDTLVEAQEIADARVDGLGDAKGTLDTAVEQQDMAQEEILALETESSALQQAFEDELAAVEEKVAELDEEQVFAFNRAFNNAIASGLPLDIDSVDLEGIENFDRQQINAFTKAYESEAKFLSIAERTGQTEKFEAKAERQKAKFLAKIGPDTVDDETIPDAADGVALKGRGRSEAGIAAKGSSRSAARAAAKDAAKDSAKGAAKAAAKASSKQAAKDAAKGSAKSAAKKAARDAARQAAKEERGKSNGKGKAKGKVKS
jgi:hypothetical protein